MSGLKPITVNTPTAEEANIYAEDDASVYLSMFGGDGVSTNGQSCKATVLSNNKVRIADGIICVGGHFARIPYGDYIDCEIENGQSGKNRNDIIVARFETTGTGGIDTYTCEVKKGTAGTTATDPEIVQEDLYKAGKVRELPLYRVKIEGLSITAVEQLFTLRKTNEELEKELASLNSKIPDVYYEEVSLHYYDGAYMTATVNVGKQFAGRPVQVTSIYKSGYPTQQTWNVSATPVDSNGSTTIWAYGSNYVSAHVMNVLVRCETDPT
jgi:hypothetical protein